MAVMTATMSMGVGGSTSATSGAVIEASLLHTLQMPKAVATREAGKSSIRQRQAATHPMLTPHFVSIMNTEA